MRKLFAVLALLVVSGCSLASSQAHVQNATAHAEMGMCNPTSGVSTFDRIGGAIFLVATALNIAGAVDAANSSAPGRQDDIALYSAGAVQTAITSSALFYSGEKGAEYSRRCLQIMRQKAYDHQRGNSIPTPEK